MQSENRLKISNPQRINRILRRICQAKLQVIVRSTVDVTVAVKGKSADLMVDSPSSAMKITHISDKGAQHLGGKGSKIQVEFIMMSTKVVFASVILAAESNSIVIAMPRSLVSVERRKNARYTCTEDLNALIELSVWRPDPQDMTAPPFYSHNESLAKLIQIADISDGGLCAVTRFPAVNIVLRRWLIDENAKIILPMQDPVTVAVIVRWSKRIKELVPDKEDSQTFTRSYRFGLEFVAPSEQLQVAIRQFIQQIAQAGAI